MLSPGSSQDSPSWLWGTVCTGTPQHVESEGWKDAPVTLKDIPSTSNPHPNLETSVSPHCTPGVVPGTAAGRTRIGTAGYPQRPPQPGHCARAPQAWGSTFLPCQPLHPLLCQPSRQPDAPRSLSLSHSGCSPLCSLASYKQDAFGAVLCHIPPLHVLLCATCAITSISSPNCAFHILSISPEHLFACS